MMNHNRIDEFFWLFGIVFPIPEDPKRKEKFDLLVGGKIENIIPQFIHILSQLIKDNEKDAEMWFRFLSEGVDYMTEKTNELPDTSIPQEEITKLMRIQLKK